MPTNNTTKRFIRLPEVQHLTGLSKSLIYLLIQQDKFPKQVELNTRTSAWLESEILAWIEERISLTRQKKC